jgi:hypothetical protein
MRLVQARMILKVFDSRDRLLGQGILAPGCINAVVHITASGYPRYYGLFLHEEDHDAVHWQTILDRHGQPMISVGVDSVILLTGTVWPKVQERVAARAKN